MFGNTPLQGGYLGLVEQKRGLELCVDVGHDRLDPVVGRPPVEDQEPELWVALPLVHEQRALDLRLVPFVVDVLLESNLWREKNNHLSNVLMVRSIEPTSGLSNTS